MNWPGMRSVLAFSLAVAFASNVVLAKELRSEAKKVEGATNIQTITLKGDTLFKFGDDKLSAAGKKALDGLLKKGSLAPMSRYRIEGHTDRIGDPKANEDLSRRRADSVRDYLLSKDTSLQLETAGMGERKPVVQCSDKLPKEQLVKCLAPNRRVTIERAD